MEQDGFQYFHSPNREKKTAVALEYEPTDQAPKVRSEEHTSELQSR